MEIPSSLLWKLGEHVVVDEEEERSLACKGPHLFIQSRAGEPLAFHLSIISPFVVVDECVTKYTSYEGSHHHVAAANSNSEHA